MSPTEASDMLSMMDRDGVAAAVNRLLAMPPRDMVATCRTVVLELLRDRHDVARGSIVGWTGAAEAERLGRAAPAVHGLDREFLEHARSLYGVVGALTWAGWAPEGLRLDDTARAIGRACAKRADDLAVELGIEPVEQAKARWLAAMHALFADDVAVARSQLVEASRLAEEAGAEDEVRLLRGYLLMAQSRSEPDDPEIGYEIERICAFFDERRDTRAFAAQLRTARAALEEPGYGAQSPDPSVDAVEDAVR